MLRWLGQSRRATRFATVGLVATLAVFGAAACDSSEDSGGSSAASLSVAIGSPAKSFDVSQLSDGQMQFLWGSLYDTLLFLDNDGSVQPNAAENFEYSADRKTLTLTLRKGMTFSNGKPVNAAAAKASLDRVRTVPGPNTSLMLSVASVEAPDESTVVIKLKTPDANLLTALAASAGVIADPSTFTESTASLDPVGSGPYTLDKAKSITGSTYVMTRRAGYWNEKAYKFDTVTVRVIADPTAKLNALRANQINAVSIDTKQSAQLKAAGFNIKRVDGQGIAALYLADRAGEVSKPLADVRVRQAINMAFDRPKFVEKLLNGAGKPTDQIFNLNFKAYDPALENTYKFDVAGAKKLLAQAGYPNGFELEIPSLVYTKTLEPSAAQALADIGIKVKWAAVPPQEAFGAIASKKYPVVFFVNGPTYPSTEVQQNLLAGAFLNPFASTDPELDALITKVNAEADPDKAAAIYRQINAVTVKKAWFAPIAFVGADYALKGITLEGNPTTSQSVRFYAPAA